MSIDLKELKEQFAQAEKDGPTVGEPLPDGSKKTQLIKVVLIEGHERVAEKTGKKWTQIELTYKDVVRDSTTSKKVALFDSVQAAVVLDMKPGKQYNVDMEKVNGYWQWQTAKAA